MKVYGDTARLGWRWRWVGGRHVDCCLYCLCLRVSAPRHPRNLRGPARGCGVQPPLYPAHCELVTITLPLLSVAAHPPPGHHVALTPASSQRYQVASIVAELFNFDDINSTQEFQNRLLFWRIMDTITNRHLNKLSPPLIRTLFIWFIIITRIIL